MKRHGAWPLQEEGAPPLCDLPGTLYSEVIKDYTLDSSSAEREEASKVRGDEDPPARGGRRQVKTGSEAASDPDWPLDLNWSSLERTCNAQGQFDSCCHRS